MAVCDKCGDIIMGANQCVQNGFTRGRCRCCINSEQREKQREKAKLLKENRRF